MVTTMEQLAQPLDVWLDCDPGHDDIVAIMIASYAENCHLLGVSTVHGNSSIEHTTHNALAVLELLGIGVPVYRGAPKPLMRENKLATHIHGENGLSNTKLLPPNPKKSAQPNAVFNMYKAIMDNPRPVVYVATGPLTNVALLVSTYPDVTSNIEKLVFMGGSTGVGNITSQAEFNMYADPEAARLVVEANSLRGKLYMVPLDVTHTVLLDRATLQKLREHPSPFAALLVDVMTAFSDTYEKTYGFKEGVPVHDACAMAAALWPDMAEFKPMTTSVSLDALTLGRTVCDVWGQIAEPVNNVNIVFRMDVPRFWSMILEIVRRIQDRRQSVLEMLV
ncbi:uridine ribohydrolase [Schizosaccharomyces japonicus yFS275]|uniref:Uridine ribohydrolase n=1 Tax=Schizosaccharomyces japonicus (strain yFS275 / FY16936) TaxID=402676 RepID=B6JX30_SCHJY|nr:uridine ribohydrolase [Schizosaccharomyces japonicus yFS275]EEB05931.2 uridine ribohydrolase [Schizosaccharomyces japonicus yFS275]